MKNVMILVVLALVGCNADPEEKTVQSWLACNHYRSNVNWHKQKCCLLAGGKILTCDALIERDRDDLCEGLPKSDVSPADEVAECNSNADAGICVGAEFRQLPCPLNDAWSNAAAHQLP